MGAVMDQASLWGDTCGCWPAGPRSGAGVGGTWFLWWCCSSWGIKTAYPIQPQEMAHCRNSALICQGAPLENTGNKRMGAKASSDTPALSVMRRAAAVPKGVSSVLQGQTVGLLTIAILLASSIPAQERSLYIIKMKGTRSGGGDLSSVTYCLYYLGQFMKLHRSN